MKVHVTGRHFEVSERLRAHIEKEAARLERFFDRIIDCEVLIGTERQMKEVEVIVKAPGHTLKATSAGSSVYRATDEAMARAKSQLKKLQGKFQARRRSKAGAVAAAEA